MTNSSSDSGLGRCRIAVTGAETAEVPDLSALDPAAVYTVLSDAFSAPTPDKVSTALSRWEAEGVRWLGTSIGARPVCLVGWSGGAPARIVCLGTAPAHRGQGLASRLTAALAEQVVPLEAETDADAVGFYQKAGFTAAEVTKDFGGTPVRRFVCRREARP